MSFFYEINELQEVAVISGVTMKIVYSEEASLAFVDFPPLAHVPMHHHDSEQIGVVLEGEVEYTIGSETKVCRKGMMFIVPPNTPHSVTVVSETPAKVLDIFTPKHELHQSLKYVK